MTAPPDPREERFRPLSELLAAAVTLVALLGVMALLLGGGAARGARVGMLVLLVGTPLARVLWLVVRWFRRGDTRFALVGVLVLVVPLAGFLLAR